MTKTDTEATIDNWRKYNPMIPDYTRYFYEYIPFTQRYKKDNDLETAETTISKLRDVIWDLRNDAIENNDCSDHWFEADYLLDRLEETYISIPTLDGTKVLPDSVLACKMPGSSLPQTIVVRGYTNRVGMILASPKEDQKRWGTYPLEDCSWMQDTDKELDDVYMAYVKNIITWDFL